MLPLFHDCILFSQGKNEGSQHQRQAADHSNHQRPQKKFVSVCRIQEKRRNTGKGVDCTVAKRRNPDAVCFLVENVKQNPHCNRNDAEQKWPRHRSAPVGRSILIPSKQHDRPMPNAPDRAAKQTSSCNTETVFQYRVHCSSPACFFSNCKQHIHKWSIGHCRYSTDERIQLDGKTCTFQL